MTQPAEHDCKVLNGLIETTIDSADGYEQAAKEAKNPEYRRLFEERAFERRRVYNDLREEVSRMGGEAEAEGTLLGKGQRAFAKLREAISSDDDKIMVEEVERGEDIIKDRYEKAMKDDELSAQARDTINRAYSSVKSGHDQMSALKHSLQ